MRCEELLTKMYGLGQIIKQKKREIVDLGQDIITSELRHKICKLYMSMLFGFNQGLRQTNRDKDDQIFSQALKISMVSQKLIQVNHDKK